MHRLVRHLWRLKRSCQGASRMTCASSFAVAARGHTQFRLTDVREYLYDHLAGDKEVGGGGKRPEVGSHHEEKNNAEHTMSGRFEIKSVNGIKCFCCGNVCQSIWNSKCMGMCVHVPLCPHGDFVLPILLSTCLPLMPSLLHLGCRSTSLANPGGCDICHANDTHTHTHTHTHTNK